MRRVLRWLAWPFQAQARLISRCLDGEAQMALGAACATASLPLFVVGFRVNEPLLIFQMSAAALLFSGLGFIASGQAIYQAEKGEREMMRRLDDVQRTILARLNEMA